MSQNNPQHANAPKSASNDNAAAIEDRKFSIGGHDFASPEDFIQFHQSTAVMAGAMAIRQEDGDLAQLIEEFNRKPGEVKSKVKSLTERAKDTYDSLTFGDVLSGVGIALAAGAAVYGGIKLYDHLTDGDSAGLLSSSSDVSL